MALTSRSRSKVVDLNGEIFETSKEISFASLKNRVTKKAPKFSEDDDTRTDCRLNRHNEFKAPGATFGLGDI